LGGVDGTKQPQPVALCLSLDADPPLELVRTSKHLRTLREAPGSDPNLRKHLQVKFGE
jgi:hypothetical protein